MLESVTRSLTPSDKKIASIGTATAAAKKWGWSVLNRAEQKRQSSVPGSERAGTPENPIGRGRPLPPPGMPLPPPERTPSISSSISIPKRKPVPPPLLPERSQESKRPVPNPPLPPRRISRGADLEDRANDEILVVAAPPESEPSTPMEEHHVIGHMELDDDGDYDNKVIEPHEAEDVPSHAEKDNAPTPELELPQSSEGTFTRGRLSGSPEEDGRVLPSWSVAVEEESRSKSIWTNFENGHS
jgi:hypothetical protein